MIGSIRNRRGGFVILACAAIVAAACGCDHGLSPDLSTPATTPGFGGTVRVVSAWPPADSVYDLRVVAFRSNPPTNILEEFVNGTMVFSDPLARDSATQYYDVRKDGLNGTFAYVAVAQQYGSNPFQDWRVVGIYTISGDVLHPSPVALGAGEHVDGVDIVIDFLHLPPQPF